MNMNSPLESGLGSKEEEAWLGMLFSQLSPKVKEMGTRVLNSRVEPLVQGTMSALNFGKAFKFTRINLGDVKPKLTNIRTNDARADSNRLSLDFDLVYIGDGDIQVRILGTNSGVRNVKISGRGRVILSPTMSQLPFVGGIQFLFITKPEIDFQFDGLAKIADLPVIKTKIKEDLLKDLKKQAVYPNRVTIPLSWTADPQLVWQPQMTGILAVKLSSVKSLPRRGGVRRMFGQDKADVYGILGVGAKEYSTSIVKNTQQATWDQWFEFPLEWLDGHMVEINMYDQDSSSADEFLGYAAIDVKNLIQTAHFLTTPTKGSLGGAQPPSRQDDQPLQSRLIKAKLQAVPGRKSKYNHIGGDIEVEMAWQPLLTIPGSTSDRLFPGATAAVLTVFVYSANNLAQFTGGMRFPAGHLPSPQATITIANYTHNSNAYRNTQQPSFNFGETVTLLHDWTTATLVISVRDTEKGGSFGSQRIPLSSLVGKDKVKTILPLLPANPSQTVTFSAKIRFPSSPSSASSSSSSSNLNRQSNRG